MFHRDWIGLVALAGCLGIIGGIVMAIPKIVQAVGQTVDAVIASATSIANTVIVCAAVLAGLAVLGYFAREIARIRVGGDLEAIKQLQADPTPPHAGDHQP